MSGERYIDGRLDFSHAPSLGAFIGKSLASFVSGNRMPAMGGDNRLHIPDHVRGQYDRTCEQVAGDILSAVAPAERWPEVTDAWAEDYCALTGKDPGGQQVTFVDGGTVTTFRDMAKREIEAMLCAAPKSAVRIITQATTPAEAVSPGTSNASALKSPDAKATEVADRLMQDFYLSPAYDPKAARPADTVKAAIAFALAAERGRA